MTKIIEAVKICKSYKIADTTQLILKEVSLSIERGEYISVMGPSGSGKSTLLSTVSGMDQVTSGDIRLDGQNLPRLNHKQLAEIRLTKFGFIFQQSSLLKNLTIFDNIILASCLAKKESRSRINHRAEELMKNMGIKEIANHDITQVSGGQLQRAAICRALMNNPEILFGDEPTGALNTSATNDVLSILSKVNEAGTSIMLVTHDVKVAARTERVLFMLDGEIVAEKYLGKIKEDELALRETHLGMWLSELGF